MYIYIFKTTTDPKSISKCYIMAKIKTTKLLTLPPSLPIPLGTLETSRTRDPCVDAATKGLEIFSRFYTRAMISVSRGNTIAGPSDRR